MAFIEAAGKSHLAQVRSRLFRGPSGAGGRRPLAGTPLSQKHEALQAGATDCGPGTTGRDLSDSPPNRPATRHQGERSSTAWPWLLHAYRSHGRRVPPFAVKFVGAGVGGGAPLTCALVAVGCRPQIPPSRHRLAIRCLTFPSSGES